MPQGERPSSGRPPASWAGSHGPSLPSQALGAAGAGVAQLVGQGVAGDSALHVSHARQTAERKPEARGVMFERKKEEQLRLPKNRKDDLLKIKHGHVFLCNARPFYSRRKKGLELLAFLDIREGPAWCCAVSV